MSHAIILGITADIGRALAERLICDGWTVTGLGRDLQRVSDLGATCVEIDMKDSASVTSICDQIGQWDLFISSVGTMAPIGPFFGLNFEDWEASITVNLTSQLRVLHALWSKRVVRPHIMFFAGGGTNNPMPNYSAYCVSKIALIKMVELIDDEVPEANVFINGPGFTRTRIHQETLAAGILAGEGLAKTESFLKTDNGTSMDDIYKHMQWCMAHPLAASGRNFSTVHDPWRDGSTLATALEGELDALRLRRAHVKGVQT